jgi:hypothetical protein
MTAVLSGYTTKEETTGRPLLDHFITPDIRERVRDVWDNA